MDKKEVLLQVEGMTCTNCSLGITKYLQKQGFEDVYVDFTTGEVQFTSVLPNIEKAKQGITHLGYTVIDESIASSPTLLQQLTQTDTLFYVSAALTLPLLLAMVLPFGFLHVAWVQFLLCLPVIVGGWLYFGRSAWSSIKAGIPNMDVLVVLGSNAAFFYSLSSIFLYPAEHVMHQLYFETAATIITLVLLGNYLEHRAIKRTTSAVAGLTKLQDTSAKRIVIRNNAAITETVAANQLILGDKVWLNEGDRIPADGYVYEGEGLADESMISGESLSVEKKIGSMVVGGTVVVSGNLKFRVSATGRQTTLSQIIAMVKKAQADKPNIQRLADSISAIFVPAIVAIASLTFLVAYFWFDIGLHHALMNSIAVLVVACPCAMGLATPTAMVVSIGKAARKGMLIKGANTLEQLAMVKQVAFDKTGTLTMGLLKIERVHLYSDMPESEVQSLLFSIEQHSSHPIAKAIVTQYKGSVVRLFSKTVEQKGFGLTATDEQGNVFVVSSASGVANIPTNTNHDIYLQKNKQLLAAFDLSDTLRPEAALVVAKLNGLNLKTLLISGDKKEKCTAIAQQTNISEVYAPYMPQDKLALINRIKEQEPIAMVGDGINDAPALVAATVGISLGNATQIAIQSAKVILLSGDLQQLPELIALSRRTMRIVKQNLFWAFFYNVLMVPLAAMGMLNPMLAAAAMSISSVFVVLNSLRLKQ